MSGNKPSFWISAADVMSVEAALHGTQEASMVWKVQRGDWETWRVALFGECSAVNCFVRLASQLQLAGSLGCNHKVDAVSSEQPSLLQRYYGSREPRNVPRQCCPETNHGICVQGT